MRILLLYLAASACFGVGYITCALLSGDTRRPK